MMRNSERPAGRKLFKTTTLGTALLVGGLLLTGCPAQDGGGEGEATTETAETSDIDRRLAKYTTVKLTADLSHLSDDQRDLVKILIEAGQNMDDAFWLQAYGDKDELMASLDDPKLQRYAEINYGPWDRLEGNAPFVEGFGAKPAGANYYPHDITEDELKAAMEENPELGGLYTMVRRDEEGGLVAVPYSEAFADLYGNTADLLEQAAAKAEDEGFRKYLELRAEALRSNEYFESDMAWMDMKSNAIDVVIGPIETYEDQLLGAKAASETFVLIKDQAWSERLARYTTLLGGLQRGLPVPDAYKAEEPGSDSDLNAYDVIYYAGDCNAGSKTIAINLPNDEKVQEAKGSRRLQLKNAMRAKFDKILVPLSDVLIAEDQRQHITFDAFFSNTMFHEVAHGLGIKNTLDGSSTVRTALGNHASALEEGKADVLGLYMVTSLHGQGELDEGLDLMDNYTTFMASIFRSIRFGSASAHGRANLLRFNFFQEMGAFQRDEATGTYRIHFDKMQEAMNALSERILMLQGDGDYDAVDAFVAQYGQEGETLRSDLSRLEEEGIPVDIVFEQGVETLGL